MESIGNSDGDALYHSTIQNALLTECLQVYIYDEMFGQALRSSVTCCLFVQHPALVKEPRESPATAPPLSGLTSGQGPQL